MLEIGLRGKSCGLNQLQLIFFFTFKVIEEHVTIQSHCSHYKRLYQQSAFKLEPHNKNAPASATY